jgi:hypothetical protein
MHMKFVPHRKHTYGHPQPVRGIDLLFLYADEVRTSQETRLWASTACYRDRFTFLYVDDVRTSQKTPTGLHDLLRGQIYFFIRR